MINDPTIIDEDSGPIMYKPDTEVNWDKVKGSTFGYVFGCSKFEVRYDIRKLDSGRIQVEIFGQCYHWEPSEWQTKNCLNLGIRQYASYENAEKAKEALINKCKKLCEQFARGKIGTEEQSYK